MNRKPDELCADLCVEITSLISHQSGIHNFLKPAHCHIVPQALLSVLAASIVFNFERRGHKDLIKSSTDKLTELVEAAYAARQSMSPEEAAAVNPMEPCGCSSAAEPTDDDLATALEKTIAEALGLDPAKVKAMKVDPSKAAIDPREAAALAAADDDEELAKAAAAVNDLLATIFGGGSRSTDGTKH